MNGKNEEAELSRERLRLVIEQMPALLWTTDAGLCFTSSQGAGLAALGLKPGDVDGRLMHELGDMSAAVPAHLRALQGESVKYEGRLCGRTFEAHVEPLRDAAGDVTGCIGVALDVTGRRQAERELRGMTETLRALIAASPLAIVTLDAESRVTSWSPAAERAFGWTADEVLGRRFPIIPDDKWDEHVLLRDRVLGGERFTGFETRRTDKHGTPIDLRISAAPLRDSRGAVCGVASFLEDVSECKRAEQALRRLASVPEQSPQPLAELDLAGHTLYLNQAARLRFPDLQSLGSRHPVLAVLAAILPRFRRGEKRSFSREVSYEQAVYHLMIYHVPEGALVRVFFHDVTEQRRARALLEREALYDRVTELPNRATFLRRLGERIEEDASRFAVLVLDVDRFRVINESLGPAAGDQLLAGLARRLAPCLCEHDLTSRLGGDELAVLLQETADAADSLRRAEALRQALGRPLEVAGQEIFPSLSIGVVSDEGCRDAESMLRDAYVAMNRARALGGGRCEIFDPATAHRPLDRLRLETDLRHAIERDELTMHYQPIVRLSDGAVIAFEALLRWHHPGRGPISPAEIIPLAEESGLIQPLSYWTLGQVCRRVREWGGNGPAVHLNLSGRLFSDPGLADRIQSALAENRACRKRLVVEITESALMENLETAVATLARIKSLGVRLAIDDFGTGYSSLSYLQGFPVDSLKIDRSFVARLGEREETDQIVRAILTLARNLGIEVTAEGVETEGQLDHLLALGCRQAQGYLFARPVDAEGARALLAKPPPWIGLLAGFHPAAAVLRFAPAAR